MRKLDPFVLVGYDGSDRAAAHAVVWEATEAVRRDQRLVVLFRDGVRQPRRHRYIVGPRTESHAGEQSSAGR